MTCELAPPVSWKTEVCVEGKWASNGCRFATRGEAEAAGTELLSRWFVPTGSRAAESDEPVNYRGFPDNPYRRPEPIK
jgi:hypothetical protein